MRRTHNPALIILKVMTVLSMMLTGSLGVSGAGVQKAQAAGYAEEQVFSSEVVDPVVGFEQTIPASGSTAQEARGLEMPALTPAQGEAVRQASAGTTHFSKESVHLSEVQPLPAPPPNERMGINFVDYPTWQLTEEQYNLRYQGALDAGATWTRWVLYFSNWTAAGGAYQGVDGDGNPFNYDALVERIEDRNLEQVVILQGPNPPPASAYSLPPSPKMAKPS